MTVKLVCFDWGGVILRICRSWEEGCTAAGIECRPRPDSPDAVAARRDLVAQYQLGLLSCEAFYQQASIITGCVYSPDDIRRIHDAWLIAEYPGIDDILTRLTATRGVTTGVLSNTNAAHWARHMPGPDGRRPDFPAIAKLTHRHASHLLRAAKPTPDAFAAFERATGFQRDEILFFDDLAENIDAAAAHGWRTQRIDPEGDTAGQITTHLHTHRVW